MGGDERRSLWDQNSSWWSEHYATRYDADYEDVILPFVKDALGGFRKIIDIGGQSYLDKRNETSDKIKKLIAKKIN